MFTCCRERWVMVVYLLGKEERWGRRRFGCTFDLVRPRDISFIIKRIKGFGWVYLSWGVCFELGIVLGSSRHKCWVYLSWIYL